MRFGGNAGVLTQAATEARLLETVPVFEDALQLIWSDLPKQAIDNTVKDYRKRLQLVCQPTMDILNT